MAKTRKSGSASNADTLEGLRKALESIQSQVTELGRRLDTLQSRAAPPAPRITRPAKATVSKANGTSARGSKELSLQGPRGADARATVHKEGLLVLKGSQVSDAVVPSMPAALASARQQLVDDRIITRQGKSLKFARDHLFASVSTAAAVVMGRNANGWREWKDAQGRSLGEIQKK